MVKNGQKHHRESYYVINGVAKSRKENTFILPHGIKISQTSWSMFFFFLIDMLILFTPSHYHPLFCVYLISLSLRCSCYPPAILHFHVSIFHVCSPCLPLLPFSPPPWFGLSLLRFSILQLLNQYLPHWKPQALFFSGRTPEWASRRGIWQAGRQKERKKEMNPEKIQQIPAWGELRLAVCSLNWRQKGIKTRTSVQLHATFLGETQHLLKLRCM